MDAASAATEKSISDEVRTSGNSDTGPDLSSASSPIVLCYHAVSELWPSTLAVRPDALQRQVSGLIKRGYRGVRFTEALTSDVGARVFAVTFDDSYLSVVSLAFPVLSRLGVPATVFMPTRADREGLRDWEGIRTWSDTEWREELAGASWAQLRELVAAGWEIGSHSRTHPDLTSITDAALRDELAGSREDCEAELGVDCTSIAYPYGLVDSRVIEATRQAGYLAGAALAVEGARGGAREPLCWPRLAIYRSDGPARLWAKRQVFVHAPRVLDGLNRLRALRS